MKIDIAGLVKNDAEKQLAKEVAKYKELLAAATPVKTGHARNSWHVEGNNIVNTAPYIDKLNAGSSIQAGPNFIEETLLNAGAVPNGTIVTPR